MGQDKEATRRGWLYYWAKEGDTIKVIPPSEMIEDDEGKIECEVFSRIVGYIRPLRNWNVGKKQEYAERQEYKVEVIE